MDSNATQNDVENKSDDDDPSGKKAEEAQVVEQVLYWSELEDLKEMEIVMERFKNSPQEQLLLIKVRFEQRIIQVKSVLQEQNRKMERLRREVEMLRIAKAYEKSTIEQAHQQIEYSKM